MGRACPDRFRAVFCMSKLEHSTVEDGTVEDGELRNLAEEMYGDCNILTN